MRKAYEKHHLVLDKCHFFSSFKIFIGMPFGSDDLRESREDIKDISALSVEVKKKMFVFK